MTERSPDDVQSWGTLGDALLEMGQYDGARPHSPRCSS